MTEWNVDLTNYNLGADRTQGASAVDSELLLGICGAEQAGVDSDLVGFDLPYMHSMYLHPKT